MLKDSVVIEDTARVVAPTATSESLLRYDDVVLERANAKIEVKIEKTERVPNDKEDNFPNKEEHFEDMSEMVAPDSVKVKIPITQKVYEDSLCKVWVSGYEPNVDSVEVYQRRIYYPVAVEKEKRDPKIVVTIGPYMGFGNKGFNYGIALNIGVPLSCLKWW